MKIVFLLSALLGISVLSFSQLKNPKRGIAYGYHSEADFQAISGSLSWWYNWANTPDSKVAEIFDDYDMDFVPMAWNASYSESKLSEFYTAHPEAKYLLGFNEPNFREQANMTPSAAAAAWPGLEAIADEFGLELVGPAVNWCGTCVSEGGVTFTNPYDYLDAFFAACLDCRVDYIAVHNYMCYAGPLAEYLDGFKKYGKKIWLTEFACWDQATITLDMQKNLLIGALDHLDNDSMIFRYSWFTGRSNNTPHIDLFESEAGQLSELGELYVNYNPVHDTTLFTPVPARIEAENYSTMSGISIEGTSDFDGIANVGWIDGGDYLEYNLDVPDSSAYYLYLRIAATASSSIDVYANGTLKTVVNVSNTGGWQNWRTIQSQVSLDTGKIKLRLSTPTGDFNINYLRISTQDNSSPSCSAGEDQEIISPENSVMLFGQASDADGDTLTYRWSQTGGVECSIESPDTEATNISGLKPGNYYFKLEVSDGYEVTSDKVRVVVKESTVGSRNLSFRQVLVYPNPTSSILHVSGEEIIESIRIRDLSGRIVSQIENTNSSSASVNMGLLKPGSYLVNIETAHRSETRVVFVQSK